MDAHHANRDRGGMRISELWRPLPWWERGVYVLAALLFLLSILLTVVSEHLPDNLSGEVYATLNRRLPDIDTLLLVASFPFLAATIVLAVRRRSPDVWHVFRRLWSVRAILVGMSVLFAISAWQCIIELATPPDRIPPNLPSFLVVPALAALALVLGGVLVAAPEVFVRMAQAKRRQH